MTQLSLKKKYIDKQRDLSEKSLFPTFPRIIKIDTCNTCNYNCVFCPQAKQSGKQGFIDEELCIQLIGDGYKAGGRELCVSMTGEPLLNNKLEKYISYAKEIGYEYVFLNTNGYLLSKERGESLLKAGIDSIKVSVNSGSKSYQLIHGFDGYDTVIKNIIEFDCLRKEMNNNCKLYISYVAVKQTLEEVDSLKKVLQPYVDDIIVMNANNRGGSINEIEECLYAGNDEYSFQFPCSQLFNNVYITAEGYMIICCQDFENLTVVADLHKESVSEAWTNQKFTEFRKKYLEHDLKGTLCQNCIYNTNEEVIPLTKEMAGYSVSEMKKEYLAERIKKLDEEYIING